MTLFQKMSQGLHLWLGAWAVVALLNAPVQAAGQRVALLIGNAAYQNEKPLRNPSNDVDLIARVLKDDLRFTQVIVRKNLGRRELADAIDQFTAAAKGADVAMVYYSGHGMQASGVNYLIPVDAQIKEAAHVKREGVSANELADALGESDARLALLVLDACRDSPYSLRTKSTAKGLARVPVQSGNLLVAYATQDGSTADDGKGANSPYAEALAGTLRKTDLRVLEVFDEVGARVRAATQQAQRPTRYGDLPVNVYLLGMAPTGAIQAVPLPLPAPVVDPEVEAWQIAQRANSAAAYQAYLGAYPLGRFIPAARVALAGLTAPSTQLVNALGGKRSINIAVATDFPPYGFVGTDLKPQGLDIDMANYIGAKLGVKVELVVVTSANRIPYLQTKKADLVISTLGKNAEREKVIDFTAAYSPFFQAVFAAKGTAVKGAADLAGKSVGVTRGAIEDLELTKIAPTSADIKRFEDNNATVSAFVSGQVQVIATGASVAGSMMARNPQLGTEYKFVLKDSPNFIGVGKGEVELRSKVNEIIATAKANGDLDRMSYKWLGRPTGELPN